MKLRSRYPDAAHAWGGFLEFSPGSVEVLATNELLADWLKNPEDLLIDKRAGAYRIEWSKLAGRNDSLSRKWEALREWQRAELVRLGFVDFATLPALVPCPSRLTMLAEFTLRTALELARENVPEMDRGQMSSFSILALGKFGAADLNFFSDLDLIFFNGDEGGTEANTRLAQSLVNEMDARGGSSIYRIDLRLRPEGDRGSLVPTQEGLEEYYAAYGEVWERCAWIRGRHVAGDEENSYHLFQSLQSFIYPRGMSPSALGELFQQKTRVEDELIAPADRDREIKRGRGGLREVEFPVLGLQLLHGATQPTLQTHDLRKAIRNLKTLGILQSHEAETLLGGYDFWRRLEDRLQMRNIRQTHLLPTEEGELRAVAASLDFSSSGELEKCVADWRDRVRKVYDSFFEEIQPKTVAMAGAGLPGNVRWQEANAARTAWGSLAPLEDLHATARTKENFRRLTPHLETQLAACVRPDLALAGLANFTNAYGSRSLLYESLCVSPKALELLIRFFESSRALGPHLVAQPELFEEVTRAGLDEARTVTFYRGALKLPKDEESAMEAVRLQVRGEELRIALRGLLGLAEVAVLQAELTELAKACLGWAWEFAGKPKWAWIGLGKLGGGALSFGSDLDLLVVGEGEEAVQKAVKFLTTDLRSGSLFKVDFRLRPYAEGALAVPVKRYEEYYGKEAQSWEVQALCRARVMAGAKEPGREFWPAVEKTWGKVGKGKKFLEEMQAMRERIATERVAEGEEERAYKTARGGLIDIEFAAQAWQMRKGLVEPNTGKVLKAMGKEFPKEGKVLEEGLKFWSAAEWWLRLDEGRGGSVLPEPGPDLDWLARRCGEKSGDELMNEAAKTSQEVRKAYHEVLG